MKKIMTALLCALGFSLVSQAEKISGTNFEALEVDANVVGKTDAGQEGQGHWDGEGVDALIATNTFTAVEVLPEEGEPYTNYVQNIAPYTGEAGYPTVHDEAQTSEKFLSINTKGGELVRNIQEGGTAQSIGNGIYFDSMVQFTATDALDANANTNDNDKLILWLRDNGNGTTNLVVTAGYINDEYNVQSKNYVVQNSVQADKWYRLTIQAIAGAVSAPGKAYVGYAIYIDGEKATYSTEEAAFDGETDYEVGSPYNNYLYNGEVHALYPSLKNWDATGVDTFTAVAFSGVGAVDDIMFTTNAYDVAFTKPPASLTVNWTVGIASITINNETFETSGSGSTNLVGGTYTVSAEATTGYCVTYSLPSTTNIDATESGVTLDIDTVEALAEINGVMYATLAEAITAAQNGDTVKLYKGNDLGNATLAIDNQNAFVLDLNGQVLFSANNDEVVSVASTLTIIDSVGGGAISNVNEEAAVHVNGGSLVIGTNDDAGASFFGTVYREGEEPLRIVRGNFYSDDETSLGSHVADGSVGNMVEGCYVVAPDTNTYVAQIGSTKYETLAEAVAAAGNGDTVSLLDDTSMTNWLRIADKAITLDLNGFTVSADAEEWAAGADAMIAVGRGGSLTIADTSLAGTGVIDSGTVMCAIKMTQNKSLDSVDNYTEVNKATLIVNGGTLKGYEYGISGNGNSGRGNTAVTINGGVVLATATRSLANPKRIPVGIYNPQENSTLTINGGYIEGDQGVYVKAGQVTCSVSAGTIVGTGDAGEYTNNGNGAEPTGAAFAIDSANYPGGAPLAMIAGGTFVSSNGVAIASYNRATTEAVTGFVSGGTFNTPLDPECCHPSYLPATEPDPVTGMYGVLPAVAASFMWWKDSDNTGFISVTNILKDTAVAQPAQAPTFEGYTFLGWYLRKEGPAPDYYHVWDDEPFDFTTTLERDTTIWARFEVASAPAAPVVDGQTVVPGEEFNTATTEKPITYPSTATVTGEVGNQTITYGTSGSVEVPAYYTASAEGNVVTLALNNNALATIGDATVAEEAKQAVEVGDASVGVTLTTTNTKLYYGVQTCSTPDGTFTLQGTPQQGTGSAMQLSVTRGENETAKFYKLYVTDVAPAQN